MTKFKGEPKGEAAGAYPNGEAWHVKFDDRGYLSTTDEWIANRLALAAEHPDSVIRVASDKSDPEE